MRIQRLFCLAISAGLVATAISIPLSSNARAEICGLMQAPVCAVGKDHRRHTYANDCWARSDGATHIRKGACKH